LWIFGAANCQPLGAKLATFLKAIFSYCLKEMDTISPGMKSWLLSPVLVLK